MTDDSRDMTVSTKKTCRDCGKQKDHSEFYTHKQNGGLRPDCKVCVNERSRKHYAENQAAYLAKRAKFREENREDLREKNRDYNRVARAKRAPSLIARDMTREEYTEMV